MWTDDCTSDVIVSEENFYKYLVYFSTVSSRSTMANENLLAKFDKYVRGLGGFQAIRRQIVLAKFDEFVRILGGIEVIQRQIYFLAMPVDRPKDPLVLAKLHEIQTFVFSFRPKMKRCVIEIENILKRLMTGVNVVDSTCSPKVTDDELEGIACTNLNKAKQNLNFHVTRIPDISDSKSNDYAKILFEGVKDFAVLVHKLESSRQKTSLPPNPEEDAVIDRSACRNFQAILAKIREILEEINPLLWSDCQFFRLQLIKYELNVQLMLIERVMSKLKNWEKHPRSSAGVNEQVFRMVDKQHFALAATRLKKQGDALFDLLSLCPLGDGLDEIARVFADFSSIARGLGLFI